MAIFINMKIYDVIALSILDEESCVRSKNEKKSNCKVKRMVRRHRVDLPEIKFPFTIIFGIDFYILLERNIMRTFLLLYASTFSNNFLVL